MTCLLFPTQSDAPRIFTCGSEISIRTGARQDWAGPGIKRLLSIWFRILDHVWSLEELMKLLHGAVEAVA
jgi:hypothetical protein